MVPCGQGLTRILSAQSALVLGSLQSPFLGGSRRGCVHGVHPVHELVRSEVGLVLGHDQVRPYDQVGDDFALALELRRLRHEALALVKHDLHLAAADRHKRR